MEQAHEHLRQALFDLIQAQIVADGREDDLELGDRLYALSHTLMHKVMVVLTEQLKETPCGT